jgi:hypothetical protein
LRHSRMLIAVADHVTGCNVGLPVGLEC